MNHPIISRMADALPHDIDLGDERQVEAALLRAEFWAADVDHHLTAVIDRARALRIMAGGEFETVTLGG